MAKSKKSNKPLVKGKKLTTEEEELYAEAKTACEQAMNSDKAKDYYKTHPKAKQLSDYLYKRAQLEKIPAELRIEAMKAIAAVVNQEPNASKQLDSISDKIKPYDSKFFYYANRVVAFLLIAAAIALVIHAFWPVIVAGLSIALVGFLAASTWTAAVAGLSSAMTFVGSMVTAMVTTMGAPAATASTNLMVGCASTVASPFIGYGAYKAVGKLAGLAEKNKTAKEEADYTTPKKAEDDDDDDDDIEMTANRRS